MPKRQGPEHAIADRVRDQCRGTASKVLPKPGDDVRGSTFALAAAGGAVGVMGNLRVHRPWLAASQG